LIGAAALFVINSPLTSWWAALSLPWYAMFIPWLVVIVLVWWNQRGNTDQQ
jgi:ABC-type branched-subunit amino acid transport system permease subunit